MAMLFTFRVQLYAEASEPFTTVTLQAPSYADAVVAAMQGQGVSSLSVVTVNLCDRGGYPCYNLGFPWVGFTQCWIEDGTLHYYCCSNYTIPLTSVVSLVEDYPLSAA